MIQRIIKAGIFDVDGTIAETERIHVQAFNKVFKEFKLHGIAVSPLIKRSQKEQEVKTVSDTLTLKLNQTFKMI